MNSLAQAEPSHMYSATFEGFTAKGLRRVHARRAVALGG